jgi:hypothetical protein
VAKRLDRPTASGAPAAHDDRHDLRFTGDAQELVDAEYSAVLGAGVADALLADARLQLGQRHGHDHRGRHAAFTGHLLRRQQAAAGFHQPVCRR